MDEMLAAAVDPDTGKVYYYRYAELMCHDLDLTATPLPS